MEETKWCKEIEEICTNLTNTENTPCKPNLTFRTKNPFHNKFTNVARCAPIMIRKKSHEHIPEFSYGERRLMRKHSDHIHDEYCRGEDKNKTKDKQEDKVESETNFEETKEEPVTRQKRVISSRKQPVGCCSIPTKSQPRKLCPDKDLTALNCRVCERDPCTNSNNKKKNVEISLDMSHSMELVNTLAKVCEALTQGGCCEKKSCTKIKRRSREPCCAPCCPPCCPPKRKPNMCRPSSCSCSSVADFCAGDSKCENKEYKRLRKERKKLVKKCKKESQQIQKQYKDCDKMRRKEEKRKVKEIKKQVAAEIKERKRCEKAELAKIKKRFKQRDEEEKMKFKEMKEKMKCACTMMQFKESSSSDSCCC